MDVVPGPGLKFSCFHAFFKLLAVHVALLTPPGSLLFCPRVSLFGCLQDCIKTAGEAGQDDGEPDEERARLTLVWIQVS